MSLTGGGYEEDTSQKCKSDGTKQAREVFISMILAIMLIGTDLTMIQWIINDYLIDNKERRLVDPAKLSNRSQHLCIHFSYDDY